MWTRIAKRFILLTLLVYVGFRLVVFGTICLDEGLSFAVRSTRYEWVSLLVTLGALTLTALLINAVAGVVRRAWQGRSGKPPKDLGGTHPAGV